MPSWTRGFVGEGGILFVAAIIILSALVSRIFTTYAESPSTN